MGKKAAITISVLIGTVLAIIFFLIILAFYFNFMWNPTIDKETCHTSIVLRSSVNKGIIQGAKAVPLKCQTEKICLAKGFNDNCEDIYGKNSNDNPITNEKISGREEVLDVLANAIYDCHELVGRGLLDFMPHDEWEKNYGIICSRISFTENTQKELRNSGDDIRYFELYEHMTKKTTPDGKSYLEEVYGIKNNDVRGFLSENLENLKQKALDEDPEKYVLFDGLTVDNWKIGSSQEHVTIVQIAPEGFIGSLGFGGITAVAVAGIIFAIPTGGSSLAATAVGITGLIGGGVVGGIVVAETNPDDEYTYLAPNIYPYTSDVLETLNIDDFAFTP